MDDAAMTPASSSPKRSRVPARAARCARSRALLAAWIAGALVAGAAGAAWAQAGAAEGSADGSAGGSADGSAGGSADGSASGSADGSAAAPVPLDSAAPEVRASASPTVVRLGAHFTLYVTATFGAGVEVNLREPVELGPAFEVRRRLSEDRRAAGGRTAREWQIDVMPWELGDLKIAPIAVTFTAFGRAGQVQTNAVPMKIVGDLGDVVDDPRAMRGLALPTGLLARNWLRIWLVTGISAVLGMVICVLWLRRRRARRTLRLVGGSIARPPRVDMTGERALERLLAIEHSCVLERDRDRKAGYAEMVEVIREYLAARYRIAVHDLTSSELVQRLASTAAPDELTVTASWLAGCDLVKYSGQPASPAEAGKALDDARALIVTTTPLQGGAPRQPRQVAATTEEATAAADTEAATTAEGAT